MARDSQPPPWPPPAQTAPQVTQAATERDTKSAPAPIPSRTSQPDLQQPVQTGHAPGPPIPFQRDPVMAVILSIVTLGLYELYWMYKTRQELKAYESAVGTRATRFNFVFIPLSPAMIILFVLLFVVVFTVLPFVITAQLTKSMKSRGLDHMTNQFFAALTILSAMFFLPFGWAVFLYIAQRDLNKFWADVAERGVWIWS